MLGPSLAVNRRSKMTTTKETAFALFLTLLLTASAPAGPLDIDEVLIMTEYEFVDGVPVGALPWDFELSVHVRDSGALHHIDVAKPGGGTYTVFETEPNGWEHNEEFATLADLRTAHPEGTYTLEFRDSANASLTTVSLDYTISAPTNPAEFTYPSFNGQAGISTNPTFTWTVPIDAGDFLYMGIDEAAEEGDEVYFAGPVAMATQAWSPGRLTPNHTYQLDVGVSRVKDWEGPDLPTMTVDGDEFYYILTFDYHNEIDFTTAESLILPLEVGQVWEYQTTDSREPASPWTTETHVLEVVEFAGREYYHLGQYESNTGTWETGVAYVRSDDQTVYLRDEGIDKEWPLSTMVPEHISVPYGEFDGYRTTDSHEQDWYNYFVPGIGLVKWLQVEDTHTVTAELLDVYKLLWPLHVGKRYNYTRRDANDPDGWSMDYEATERVVIDSQEYFRVQVWNYGNDAATEDAGFVRSTEDALYGYNPNGEEYLEFQKAPVGTKWNFHQEQSDDLDYKVIEIVAIEPLTTPYGSFAEAYKHRRFRCVNPDDLNQGRSPDWYEWVVPGIGKVKEEDYWADYPPAVMELTSIETSPGPAMLHDWNQDGIVSIVGDVPPFVQCVYFGSCPGGVDTIAVGDCNGDDILSIVGDVPCFVDCVYFGSCP
jgi:hypothetical protein